MCLKKVILSLILMEVATKCFIAGLQCYVCEDCKNNEDFKELHICGEIYIRTTIKPITQPEISSGSTSIKTTTNPIVESPTKPSTNEPAIDDYSYEDGEEKPHEVNSQGTVENTATQVITTKTITATQSKTATIFTTQGPTRATAKPATQNSTTSSAKEKTTSEQKTTTQFLVTEKQQTQVSIQDSSVTNTTTITTLSAASTLTPQSPLVSDYDDYWEYEDPISEDKRSVDNLLKINEPVCYMIKYQANNTILTKRGCNAFINNKYLTCQSLSKGAPIESCRICSSDGCNKFSDNQGISLNAASVLEHNGAIIVLLGILTISLII